MDSAVWNRGEQTSLFPRYLSTTFLSFGSLHDLCVAHKPFTMSYLTNKSVPAVADRVKREAINMRFNALSFTGTKRFHVLRFLAPVLIFSPLFPNCFVDRSSVLLPLRSINLFSIFFRRLFARGIGIFQIAPNSESRIQ